VAAPRRHRHELTEVELLSDRAGPATGAEGRLEDRDELERGLRHLTDEQRTVIALRYYLGLTDAEVAAATGLPVGTVKSRIFRALDALRAALAAEARGAPSRRAEEGTR
jgi:RNA polymerase sigma factor (sigma-70 family)